MPNDPAQLAHSTAWPCAADGARRVDPALLAAQAQVNLNIVPDHQQFLACLRRGRNDEVLPEMDDFSAFTQTVLGWEPTDLTPIPDVATLPEEFAALEVALPEYHETLRPTYGVLEFSPPAGQAPWLMLIQCLPIGTESRCPDGRQRAPLARQSAGEV